MFRVSSGFIEADFSKLVPSILSTREKQEYSLFLILIFIAIIISETKLSFLKKGGMLDEEDR